MTKTTIDGLKVRDSQPNRRPTTSQRVSSVRSVDFNTTKSPKHTLSSSANNHSSNSFLDPVETFNFDEAKSTLPRKSFNKKIQSDWSDLVEENSVLPTSTNESSLPENTFLGGWDEQDTNDFLAQNIWDTSEEDVPEKDAQPRHPRNRKHHKKRHLGRIFAISFVCLLLIGGGVIYKWGDELISKLTNGRSGLWDAINSIVSDEVPFDTDVNTGRTNILVFGTEGYNMNGDTAYGAHDGAQLTDSIMVISLDQQTKDVALLSLPRDLKVPMACSAGKINEVFWCHNQDGTNEIAGAQALMDQIGDVLGIKFQYYAHINWASLIDIIDTIGGITVTLDENIADYNYTGAVAQAGVPIEVNGEQALGLARARHGTRGGDFTRGNTQQKIVEAMINKIMQNGIGVTEALSLVNILGDNLRSNFSTDNIKAGVRILAGFNIANIRQVPLVDYDTNTFYMTTAEINNISYVVPSAGENNYREIRQYVSEMFNSDPTAREHARITIYNASGQYGVASAERERLNSDGYEVASIGDAEIGSCLERYCIYSISQNFPATSTALAERYSTIIKNANDLPESIEPGDVDFVIILGIGGDEV